MPGGLLRRLVVAAAGAVAYAAWIRPWQLRWGATHDEANTPMPGDHLVPEARYVTTRAVTIDAPAGVVWTWLVQLGQGRGGFYTYDWLEQLAGAAIKSADRVIPELQRLNVGDTIPLSPVGGPKVALLEPSRVLVLADTMDLRTSRSIPPQPPTWWAMDWTWSFSLRSTSGRATRLLVRTRADFRPRTLLIPAAVLLLEPIHFVMERGMLLGLRRRAERRRVTRARVSLREIVNRLSVATEGVGRSVDYTRVTAYRRPPALYRHLQGLGIFLASLGVVPESVVVLEVRGRRSGKVRRNVVVQTSYQGERYLVALAGESEWVRNVRAATGQAVIRHGRAEKVDLVEVPVDERPPILWAYLHRAGWSSPAQEARHYFGLPTDPTLEEIRLIVHRYPVFRVAKRSADAGN